MFEIILLAILQGIAEFLPISSSGHLVIGEHVLGLHAPGMRLDIGLHVGTLVSVAVFYWSIIWRIVRRREWGYMGRIVSSAVPACLLYFIGKEWFDATAKDVHVVGVLLMVTGAILVGTRFLPRGTRPVGVWGALLMGVAQACALWPGLSRSGLTLAAARLGKIDAEKSAEFSFLMSAPLIVGGLLLEIAKSLAPSAPGPGGAADVPWGLVAFGAAISAVVGYFALKLLLRTLRSASFWLFGFYCLTAGLLTVILV